MLADYAQSVTYGDLPEEAVNTSQRLLVDSIGCSLGGIEAPTVQKLQSLFKEYDSGDLEASVIGTDHRLPVEHAALINSTLVRYLDFNDTFISAAGGSHPSDQIPTILSVAEAVGASGEELIEAMVVGYEVQCAGMDLDLAGTKKWDYVIWAVQGATAAVGKLMGLSDPELANALGMAVTANNALEIARLGDVSMWKGIAQANGCHNAVLACKMAREGITGPREVYEGPHGFFDVMANEDVSFEDVIGNEELPRITKTQSITSG
jgi:2-methylcitrate dehydratase